DLGVSCREMAMPEEAYLLLEWPLGGEHAVQPPQLQLTQLGPTFGIQISGLIVGVIVRDLVVAQELFDRALVAKLDVRVQLGWGRAESGPPEEMTEKLSLRVHVDSELECYWSRTCSVPLPGIAEPEWATVSGRFMSAA